MTDANAIKRHIADLHRELEKLDGVDAETRELLEELRDDLERVAPEDDAIGHRVREARRRFMADHPQLASVLDRVAETLSAMGI